MTDTGKTQSINLIKSFVDNVLGGNIDKLKNFSFLNLNDLNNVYIEKQYKDKITPEHTKNYGDYLKIIDTNEYINHNHDRQNKPFIDYDTMNLARAIYFLLFNKLPDLTWEDITWEVKSDKKIKRKYRGETINTFNTLINESNYEIFFQDIDDNHQLRDEIKDFLYKVFSIGNFMLLPTNTGGCSMTLNRYKGCLGDYSDRFFNHILNKDNEYINNLLSANKFWYNLAENNKKIKQFIDDNYLEDYFDDNNKLNYTGFAPYYRYWYFDNTKNKKDKEIYADYIRNYIKVVTNKIDRRADRMIKDLKQILSEEN